MASKGKGKEKTKSPFLPVEVVEIQERYVIPGKLSEKRWLDLLSHNEGVEIVSDLVVEVFEVAFSIVYSHYLEKQAFPYAISNVKKSLLQIIEWQFLGRDEGEKGTGTDPSWTEDEEPMPATVDSWARGIVPTAYLTSLQSVIDTTNPVQVQSSLKEEPDMPLVQITLETSTEHAHPDYRKSSEGSKGDSKLKESSQLMRSRPVARHPRARLVALQHPSNVQGVAGGDGGGDKEEVAPLSLHSHTPNSFTEELSLIDRPLPYGMKPIQLSWQKEVTYDERGNIVDMVKLDPTKFPKNCVKPLVSLVKPPSQVPTLSRARSRDHPSKNSPTYLTRQTPSSRLGTGIGLRGEFRPNTDRGSRRRDGEGWKASRFPEMPALPSLVDTIDPMPGVTVREANRTVQGPKIHVPFTASVSPRGNLLPIHPYHNPPRVSAGDSRAKVKLTLQGDGDGKGSVELDPVISCEDKNIYVQV